MRTQLNGAHARAPISRTQLMAGGLGVAVLALAAAAALLLPASPTSASGEATERSDLRIDVIDRLMADCHTLEEATAVVAAAARANGTERWSVRTDGPFSYPVGQRDIVVDHVKNGCYVYSGAGWDGDGVPIFFLAGPETI